MESDTHCQVAALVKRNQDSSVIQSANKDIQELDQSAGRIARKDSQSKGHSVESPNHMEEEWVILSKEIVKARTVVQDLVINGVFCGIQSVRMVSMRLHAASVHPSVQITW